MFILYYIKPNTTSLFMVSTEGGGWEERCTEKAIIVMGGMDTAADAEGARRPRGSEGGGVSSGMCIRECTREGRLLPEDGACRGFA